MTVSVLHIDDGNGSEIAVSTRRSPKAKRVALKVDPAKGGAELVLPQNVSDKLARDFLFKNIGWLKSRLNNLPERVRFAAETEISILGKPHVLRHDPTARRGVWQVEGTPSELWVSGDEAHLERRVTDFLKRELRAYIQPRAVDYAGELGRKPGRISIRDTRSRWGSCSSKGDLSFSWRLILAPRDVLDYVVAHEVAHLVEMNHSRRFWALVEQLHPNRQPARSWLKRHGALLHSYGKPA